MKGHNLLCLFLSLLLFACTPAVQAPAQPEQAVQPQAVQGEWQEPPQEQELTPLNAAGEVLDYACTTAEYQEGLYCFGLVKNIGDVPASYEVILTKRDADGNLATRESTYISDIQVGENSIFQFYGLDMQDCEGCEISLNPTPLEYGEIYTSINVLSHQIRKLDYTNGFEIFGEVENQGERNVEYATINAALFDDQGKLLGVGVSFPDKNPFPTGEKATFSLVVMGVLEGNFKNYQIYPITVTIHD